MIKNVPHSIFRMSTSSRLDEGEKAFSNVRPVSLSSQAAKGMINTRGRVFRCKRCTVSEPYQGERSKVILHIFRKHTALDMVPFYCAICKFVSSSITELVKHVQPSIYPAHQATVQAMLANGEEVDEAGSLLQNLKHRVPDEINDMERLPKKESDEIYASRRRVVVRPAVDVLQSAMERSKIPVTAGSPASSYRPLNVETTRRSSLPVTIPLGVLHRTEAKSPTPSETGTVDILPGLLGKDVQLSPCRLSGIGEDPGVASSP